MEIGLLQAGHMPEEIQAELGDYVDIYGRLLSDHGIRLTAYPVVDEVFPESVHAHSGWLISGSRHGAYDDLPWIPPLERFIRDAYAAHVPLVGICFGHQIIAQALGGRVEKFPGGWAIGRHVYDWQDEEVALNVWHQDQVTQRPNGATVIASSPFCANAALMYGDDIFTLQAHPEFDRRATEMLLQLRGPGVVPDDLISAAKEALNQPTDDARLGARIAGFFQSRIGADAVA